MTMRERKERRVHDGEMVVGRYVLGERVDEMSCSLIGYRFAVPCMRYVMGFSSNSNICHREYLRTPTALHHAMLQ
jgi:hypothetical protein